MSEISEVVAGQVNERLLEVPTNANYFADLAILEGRQPGAQNPFDAVVREVADLGVGAGLAWRANTAYLAGTIINQGGTLYVVNTNFTSPGTFNTVGLTLYTQRNISWANWTPTVTSTSPGLTPPTISVTSAAYEVRDRTMRGRFDITCSNIGTASGFVQIPLPSGTTRSSGYGGTAAVGTFYESEIGVTGIVLSSGSNLLLILPSGGTPFSGSPRTWRGSFELEVATPPT